MTCQEFRLYFEDPLRQDAELRSELEHLAHCGDCARYVEAQRELGNNLRLLRESVPQYPASLDAAVPAAYRRVMAEKTAVVIAVPRRRTFAWWRWSAVAAAILLAGVLLYRNRPQAGGPAAGPAAVQPTEAAPSAMAAAETPIKRPQAKKPLTVRRSHPAALSSAATSASLPPGFRSLMYCDELSCGEAMEVIRVQLPSSALTLGPAGGGGPVLADVLVGPDGIARGIRVVE